jgi:hypothetical protein
MGGGLLTSGVRGCGGLRVVNSVQAPENWIHVLRTDMPVGASGNMRACSYMCLVVY